MSLKFLGFPGHQSYLQHPSKPLLVVAGIIKHNVFLSNVDFNERMLFQVLDFLGV